MQEKTKGTWFDKPERVMGKVRIDDPAHPSFSHGF